MEKEKETSAQTAVPPKGENGQAMALFRLNPGLVLWTWITFALLFILMKKYVIPRVAENLRDRENEIADAVDNAEMIKQQLEETEDEREAILAKAKGEADEILSRMREEVAGIRRELIEKAQKEAAQVVTSARERMEQEREVLLKGLYDDLAEIVCDASGRLVQRSYTSADDLKLSRELVEQI